MFHAAHFPKSASQFRAVLDHRALEAAMRASQLNPSHLEAGIAAGHLWRPIDWPHIVVLYTNLHYVKPTDIVRLNWAVALSQAGETEKARAMLAAIATSGELNGNAPFEAPLRTGLSCQIRTLGRTMNSTRRDTPKARFIARMSPARGWK